MIWLNRDLGHGLIGHSYAVGLQQRLLVSCVI